MEAREQVIRKETGRLEILDGAGAEEQRESCFDLSIREKWLRKSPQPLPDHVQDPATKLSGADEALSRELIEKRQEEEASCDSETRYRNILENIEDGYFEVDRSGKMIFFNGSMCKILGYSEQELRGMNNRFFMSEETSKKVYQTFNQVYRSGEPTKAFGWELIRKDGERRYVETSVSLVRNSEGEPVGFRGIARDITELRALDLARKKAMNHLSHELGTPLAIINSVFLRIPAAVESGNLSKVNELVRRGTRHVERLNDLQYKISDILGGKQVAKEKWVILGLIDTALRLLEEVEDTVFAKGREALLKEVRKTLESMGGVEELRWETVQLDEFLEDLCRQAELKLNGRQLNIIREFEPGMRVTMDRKVLGKVCGGLLKNAIENTPDEGEVEVETKLLNGHPSLQFRDFGIGITRENQDQIFQGFFHTQDSQLYSSKHPYSFNAGGTGLDLLRASVFAERLGFRIDFSSVRCRYLPSDREVCPGRISSCPFIKSREECFGSGGTLFKVLFPSELFSGEVKTDA
jgi:PAS domain S-box-containing protein